MVSRRVLDLATYLARHQAPVGRELVLLRVPTAAQQARALAAAQARAPRPSAPRAPRGGQPDEPMFVPLAARCLRGARWSAALPGRAAASAGGAVMTSAGARACVLSCDCRLGVANSEIVRRGAAGIARAAPRRPRAPGRRRRAGAAAARRTARSRARPRRRAPRRRLRASARWSCCWSCWAARCAGAPAATWSRRDTRDRVRLPRRSVSVRSCMRGPACDLSAVWVSVSIQDPTRTRVGQLSPDAPRRGVVVP